MNQSREELLFQPALTKPAGERFLASVRPLGYERNHFATGLRLTFARIGQQCFQIKIPPGRLVLACLAHFIHQFVLQHGAILPSIPPECKSLER